MIDIGNCYCNYGKIEQALGWRPRVDLNEGLRRTIEYYRKNWRHYWGDGGGDTAANEDTVSKFGASFR